MTHARDEADRAGLQALVALERAEAGRPARAVRGRHRRRHQAAAVLRAQHGGRLRGRGRAGVEVTPREAPLQEDVAHHEDQHHEQHRRGQHVDLAAARPGATRRRCRAGT